ncbi:MAG: peptidoglycan DD-metalloendopeptidase family protein [Clostridia bacterium]|nr:peptidoglycan DD-metalloendopeptidase family protein [Clostridia bacterium]
MYNKIKKFIISGVLCAAILSAMLLPRTSVVTVSADTTTQSLQEQISALEAKQAELKQQISDLNDKKSSEMEVKANLDALGDITQQKIKAAETLSEQLAASIESTSASIAEKEEQIKTTFDKFLDRLVVSYEEGEASYLSIILNSSDMADFLSKMDMVSSMLEYDRNLKIQYENEKTALEADKASLEEAKTQQTKLIAELEEDKAEYEQLSEQQATYIKSLEEDISKANTAYEEAKAQENALDAELQQRLYEIAMQQKALEEQRKREEEERRRQLAEQGITLEDDDTNKTDASNVYKGDGFAWPLYGYSYISSGFGWRTLGGWSDYHRGIDIPAPYGTPIHASKGGQVITATGHGSYGNYVVIDHGLNSNGDGESTLYAHMSSIGCSVGQYVNQGDVIGYVGSTGYSTGNHTHFEVRINGEALNPMNFVSP